MAADAAGNATREPVAGPNTRPYCVDVANQQEPTQSDRLLCKGQRGDGGRDVAPVFPRLDSKTTDYNILFACILFRRQAVFFCPPCVYMHGARGINIIVRLSRDGNDITDGRTDGQTDRQTGRQAGRQTYRHRHRHKHRHRHGHKHGQ